MGFWHTGYLEFHEPSGLDGVFKATPTVYRCLHCGNTFESADGLRYHRFEAHPFKKPLLFIQGLEIGNAPETITGGFSPKDVIVESATLASVNDISMPASELGHTLAAIRQDVANIVLRGDGVEARFQLRIEIASDEDLMGVEEAFLGLASQRRLDVRAINQFIDRTGLFKTAAAYRDGICEYLYGVLAKERSATSSLPFRLYREKFNRAIDILRTLERPLAHSIVALVRFHFNRFSEAGMLSSTSRVGRAAQALDNYQSGDSSAFCERRWDLSNESLESLLTDWDTERLIRWALLDSIRLPVELAEMQAMLTADLAESDRVKLHLLIAQAGVASRDPFIVRRHARELRNSPGFEQWAEAVIETSKTWRTN